MMLINIALPTSSATAQTIEHALHQQLTVVFRGTRREEARDASASEDGSDEMQRQPEHDAQ